MSSQDDRTAAGSHIALNRSSLTGELYVWTKEKTTVNGGPFYSHCIAEHRSAPHSIAGQRIAAQRIARHGTVTSVQFQFHFYTWVRPAVCVWCVSFC